MGPRVPPRLPRDTQNPSKIDEKSTLGALGVPRWPQGCLPPPKCTQNRPKITENHQKMLHRKSKNPRAFRPYFCLKTIWKHSAEYKKYAAGTTTNSPARHPSRFNASSASLCSSVAVPVASSARTANRARKHNLRNHAGMTP